MNTTQAAPVTLLGSSDSLQNLTRGLPQLRRRALYPHWDTGHWEEMQTFRI